MIRGKQIYDNSIPQSKLNLQDPTNPQDAATKNYVDTQLEDAGSGSTEKFSAFNKNMAAQNVSVDGQQATLIPLAQQPTIGSGVDIYLNGLRFSHGEGLPFYFMDETETIIRVYGEEVAGDKLFFNPSIAGFNLTSPNDLISFVYLISENASTSGTGTPQPSVSAPTDIETKKIVTASSLSVSNSHFYIICDTTTAQTNALSSLTITLPASPTNGKRFHIKDGGNAENVNVIVDGNGKTIQGNATSSILGNYGYIQIMYDSELDIWLRE